MIWNAFVLALQEIRRNVMRSFLTILGIVIGVAAVITMVTIGGGATAQVTNQIESLGSNLLHVRPGQRGRGPGGARSTADMFEVADAKAIAREISELDGVAPVATKGTQVIYGNKNWSTTVTGSTNAFLQVRDWSLKSGRQFTLGELQAGKTVCILGATVRTELFGDQEALGTTIRLEKLSCQVIGELESKGQSSFGQDQDDFVLLPLRAIQRRIAGNTDVGSIYISAQDGVSTDEVKQDIESLMRERRRITSGEDDDFHVNDMQELVSMMTGTTEVLTRLLGAVAAVSLLVGGIGIMNIMLVSVTERTREIGIRMAMGATRRQVLTQFLLEALVLCLVGGFVGIALGFGASKTLANLANWSTAVSPQSVGMAVAFSALVGLFFGAWPARRAASLDPIEALRYE